MIKRLLQPRLEAVLDSSRVVYLTGARQSGKTTLVRNLAEEKGLTYSTLDRPDLLSAARDDPFGFIENRQRPLVIDEAQYAPQLLKAIKVAVDSDNTPGQFLLTGSSNLMAMPSVSESLAGRMLTVPLHTLSQAEIEASEGNFLDLLLSQGRPDMPDRTESRQRTIERIVLGGYPEIVSHNMGRRTRMEKMVSYIDSVIKRDIRELSNIRDAEDVPALLAMIASRSANLINVSDLSRDLKISNVTVGRYLNFLKQVYLVKSLPSWRPRRFESRLIKSPKIYICDTGLMAAILKFDSSTAAEDPVFLGKLFETFVVTEMIRLAGWSQHLVDFYHFRSASGQEIDLIAEDSSGQIVAVECKAKHTISRKDYRAIESLRDRVEKKFKVGIVIYLGQELLPLTRSIYAVPVTCLWQ